jgi:hypothetical protein
MDFLDVTGFQVVDAYFAPAPTGGIIYTESKIFGITRKYRKNCCDNRLRRTCSTISAKNGQKTSVTI